MNSIIIKREYTQKRVARTIRRSTNLSEFRNDRYFIRIFANRNIRVSEQLIKSLTTDILSSKGLTLGKFLTLNLKPKFYLIPNKLATNRGILVRMGGGKTSNLSKVLYLTPNSTAILLIPSGPVPSETLLIKLLDKLVGKYSFLSYSFLP